MLHFEWNELDEAAAREGEALKQARRHKSVVTVQPTQRSVINKDQAVWDEQLEVHFTECSYCGRTLTDEDSGDEERDAADAKPQPQDAPVCGGCRFLHEFMWKKSSRNASF